MYDWNIVGCDKEHHETNKNQGVFVKHYMYAPGGNKVQKANFSFKVKVTDLDVIWKGVINGVCMPSMKSLSVTIQKL